MKDSISLSPKTQFANPIRYTPFETYYARLKVKGKLLKGSLETTFITVAKMKLGDFEKEERQRPNASPAGSPEAHPRRCPDALPPEWMPGGDPQKEKGGSDPR